MQRARPAAPVTAWLSVRSFVICFLFCLQAITRQPLALRLQTQAVLLAPCVHRVNTLPPCVQRRLTQFVLVREARTMHFTPRLHAGCLSGCAVCSSSTTCTTCGSGHYLSGNSCPSCSVCTGATYPSGGCTGSQNTVCSACPSGCSSCSSATVCTNCVSNEYLSGSSCLQCSTCPTGQYASTPCAANANTVCAGQLFACTPVLSSCLQLVLLAVQPVVHRQPARLAPRAITRVAASAWLARAHALPALRLQQTACNALQTTTS